MFQTKVVEKIQTHIFVR